MSDLRNTYWYLGLVPALSIGLALGITGCTSGDGDDDVADDDATGDDDAADDDAADDDAAGVNIQSSDPAPDSTNAYYRQSITVSFTAAVASATFTLQGTEGDISGSTSSSDDKFDWTFDPTNDLVPSQSYSVTVNFDGQTQSWSFTTSSLGADVSDPTSLVGRTYNLDLLNANITEPPGVGSILAGYLGDVIILFSPTAVDAGAGSIEVLGALGQDEGGVGQDMCYPTLGLTDETPGSFDNPYFQVGPTTFEADIADIHVVIGDLLISGDFAADGSAVEEAVFAGLLDARDFAGLLGDDADGVCALLGTLGISCQTCPDSEVYCLSIHAQDIHAGEVLGAPLTPRSDADVAADPTCAEE